MDDTRIHSSGDDYRISLDNPSRPEADFSDEYFSIVSNTTPITIHVPNQFSLIQEAIDYSIDGDTVFVSAGNYYSPNLNITKNIFLIGEDNELTILDGQDSRVAYFHENSSARFENFTIQNSHETSMSGAIKINGASPILSNLIIKNNGAEDFGAGIYMTRDGAGNLAEPLIEDCIFQNNYAGENGGAVYVSINAYPTFENCLFDSNTATSNGGAIFVNDGNIEINNSNIRNNEAEINGGGIYSSNSTVDISNSIISNNTSYEIGTALYISNNSSFLANQVTIYGNNENSFIYLDCSNSYIYFNSSILWNNNGWSTQGPCNIDSNFEIYMDYTNSQNSQFGYNINDNSYPGLNNMSLDPQFTDPENGDFTLQATSPCVDAGDPNLPLDPDGTRTEMGAYSFFQIPGCTDEYACNYNEDANLGDSCDYSCHDIGDYHLYFDGTTGFNNPVTGSAGDGSTYINCGNTLNMNGSFTVGGWVKNDGMDYTTIMSKRERPNNDYYNGWHLSYENTGFIEFIFQDFSNGGPTISVTTPQIFDELFHLVAVFESESHLSLYVNGILVNRVETNFTGLSNNNAPFLISGLQDPGWWTWDGILDELFVYEGVLSDSQIHDISNNHLSLSEIDMSSYWKFNSGQGNILYDHSGNENHGTIYGATWAENIEGCTDELACNYNLEADFDDGSCDYSCSDSEYALSFNYNESYVNIGSPETLDFMLNDDFILEIDFYASESINSEENYYLYSRGHVNLT